MKLGVDKAYYASMPNGTITFAMDYKQLSEVMWQQRRRYIS